MFCMVGRVSPLLINLDFTHVGKMLERVKEVARYQSQVGIACVRPANDLVMRAWMLAGRGRNDGLSRGL